MREHTPAVVSSEDTNEALAMKITPLMIPGKVKHIR
jgi:hypothetical protein